MLRSSSPELAETGAALRGDVCNYRRTETASCCCIQQVVGSRDSKITHYENYYATWIANVHFSLKKRQICGAVVTRLSNGNTLDFPTVCPYIILFINVFIRFLCISVACACACPGAASIFHLTGTLMQSSCSLDSTHHISCLNIHVEHLVQLCVNQAQ